MSKKYFLYGITGVAFLILLYAVVPENDGNSFVEKTKEDKVYEEENREKAEEFEVVDVKGEKIALSDYKGKKIMLNFWATWCPPCNAEMPYVSKLSTDEDFEYEVLTINLIETEKYTKEEVINFVDGKGLKFKVAFDDGDKVANLYNIRSIPTTIFIDEDGYIIRTHIGELEEEIIEEL
jgi:thiol-disulfide isomerase/thioredoxin